MPLGESDWERVQQALWAAVRAHEARLGETTAEYVAAIQEALRAAGAVMDAATEQLIADYLDAMEHGLRAGIDAAVAPVAQAAVPAAMRSAFIAERTAEAWGRAWPDGLTLSRRVWRWQEGARRGVSDALAAALRTERASADVLMDMQRAIEAQAGERFALESAPTQDWAARLYDAGRASIHTPGAMTHWQQTFDQAMRQVAGLREGGTRRQAEHALQGMRAAIAAGRMDLLDRQVRWWLYDKQLYLLRRIARTEMATAHQRAVIAASRDDPEVLGYRWRLSASHAVPDICDDYARAEFGLGAGVWPKARVPAATAHPQCMCALTPTTRAMRKDGVRGQAPTEALLRHAGGAESPARAPGGQTGADSAADPQAEAAYERIRASTTDVEAIARATGIKPANVQKVKEHTFLREHLLDRFVEQGVDAYVGRFQASAGIAAAWTRLAAGQGTRDDLHLLRHEAAEAWFMRRHGPSYNAAHTAAQARYPWRG